jgi:chorismate mutase
MSDASADPVVQRYREQISRADLAILEAVNRRVSLVAGLHDHKRAKGYDLVDPGREASLIRGLEDANTGPLSHERLAELYGLLIEISTSEAARLADPRATAG